MLKTKQAQGRGVVEVLRKLLNSRENKVILDPYLWPSVRTYAVTPEPQGANVIAHVTLNKYHLSPNYYITARYFCTINFGRRNVKITSQKLFWNYFWAL